MYGKFWNWFLNLIKTDKPVEEFMIPKVELLSTGIDAQARINGKIINQLDFESMRYIFRWEDFVVKVDPERPGESNNKYAEQALKEWNVYLTVKPEDRVYFAEVVGFGATACGRNFSVQRFIPNMVHVLDWAPNSEIIREAMGDHAQAIADRYGISDIHWHNFGIVDDEPMLYDLGVTYYLRGHPKVGDGLVCECVTCVEYRRAEAQNKERNQSTVEF